MFAGNSKYLEIAGDIPSKAKKQLLHEKKKLQLQELFFFSSCTFRTLDFHFERPMMPVESSKSSQRHH